MAPTSVASLVIIVLILLAGLTSHFVASSSPGQNRGLQGDASVRVLTRFGYALYGGLVVFFLLVEVASLLGIVAPGVIRESSRLPGVLLFVLGAAGLWFSAWRLAQHVKRHGIR